MKPLKVLYEEAQVETAPRSPAAPITPANVLASPLDGNAVLPPNVTVNQDTAAAPQNRRPRLSGPRHEGGKAS